MQGRSFPLLAFCNTSKQWLPSTSRALSERPTTASNSIVQADGTLTVLTYNVYSGHASSHIAKPALRTKAAIALLRRSRADIIALQEVALPFEGALRRERWLREQYAISSLSDYFLVSTEGRSNKSNNRDAAGEGADEGCVLCVRRSLVHSENSVNMTRLPGQQGKVLVSTITAGGTRFATSHFESLAENAHVRRQQYGIVSFLLTDGLPLVALGDFNHSAYSELDGMVAMSALNTPPCFVDVQASRSSSSTPEQLLRHQSTFGVLYPYFAGSREKRKGRRSDLILHSREHFSILQSWTDGAKPIEQATQPYRQGDNTSGQTTQTQKLRKIRCAQGKGGFAYASDHLAVMAKLKPLNTPYKTCGPTTST